MQRLLTCSIRAHCMARIHPYSAGQGRGAKKRGNTYAAATERRDMIRADRVARCRREHQPFDWIIAAAGRKIRNQELMPASSMPPTIGRKAAIQFFGALQRAACGLGEPFRRLECPAATDTHQGPMASAASPTNAKPGLNTFRILFGISIIPMNALTRSAFSRGGAFGRLSKSLCMAASGSAFHSANLARPTKAATTVMPSSLGKV
jgi:hypothetical protein